MIYCIDTSSLVDAHRSFYPRPSFPSVWEKLEDLISDGRLLAPDEVLKELGDRDDDLHKWAKVQDGFFAPLDGPLQAEVRNRVLPEYPRGHPMLSLAKTWADPWVIGLARVRGERS